MDKKQTLLQQQIKLASMTQKQFAEKIGVSEMTVFNWVKGNTGISARYVSDMKDIGITNEAILNPSEISE